MEELQHALQRVSGTTLDAQGAANAWAGTDDLDLLGALNAKAGTTGVGLLAVLNVLAGTPGQGHGINYCAGQLNGQASAYFGHHILNPLETNISGSGVSTAWPSWSPTTMRLWNTNGYYATKGAYAGIAWASINTADGVYDWTLFDAALAKHKANGTTDLTYAFGYTPTWAANGLIARNFPFVDTDANGIADGWDAYSAGTTGTITRSVGAAGQRIQASGLGGAAGDKVGTRYWADGPTVGTTYTVEYDLTIAALAAGKTVRVDVEFFDSGYVWQNWASLSSTTAGHKTFTFTPPVGTVHYSHTIAIVGATSGTTNAVDATVSNLFYTSTAAAANDQAPADVAKLGTFATAVANRAVAQGLPIKNWEVWNEPNNGTGTWVGTYAQMIAMSQAVYNAVKAVDATNKVLTPSPQGNSTTWMNAYLAAGGGSYADVMAFHGYTSATPETIATLIDSYKTIFTANGQGAKPIWDTEAMDLRNSNPALQAIFLAVYYALHKAKGVERFYWYAWDGDQGQEWFYNTGLNAVAVAHAAVVGWMAGATVSAPTTTGTVWTVPLTKSGEPSLIVWDSAGASAYSTSYSLQTTLAGVTAAVTAGSVTLGTAPILLR